MSCVEASYFYSTIIGREWEGRGWMEGGGWREGNIYIIIYIYIQ